MSEMRITVRQSREKANHQKTAAELLERCRAFYQDEENEAAFREWKAQRKKKGA